MKRISLQLLCCIMALLMVLSMTSLASISVSADDTTPTTLTASTSEQFVTNYNKLVNAGGDGILELTADITLTALTNDSGGSKFASGSGKGQTIIIRSDSTMRTLTVNAACMFSGGVGTIRFENLTLTGSSLIAFNGNKFVASGVSADNYKGDLFLGSQGGGALSANCEAEFINSRFGGIVCRNERGNVNANDKITVSGTTWIGNLYACTKNGGSSTGNMTIDVTDSGNISNLYLTVNGKREGNVYLNIDTTQRVNKLYLTSPWNSDSGIVGDVIVKVDKTSVLNIAPGIHSVTKHKVILLNNGASVTSGLEKMTTVINSPTGVYASAVLNDTGAFADKITVKNNSSDYDKAIVYNSEDKVADYSTTKTDAGFELAIGSTGTFTTSFEKSSEVRVRGVQKGNDGTSVRFIGGIDTLECNGVGFEIYAYDYGKEWGKDSKGITGTVYTSILADGEKCTAASLASTYVFCAEISGIPKGTGEVKFTVKAFKLVGDKREYSGEHVVSVEF